MMYSGAAINLDRERQKIRMGRVVLVLAPSGREAQDRLLVCKR